MPFAMIPQSRTANHTPAMHVIAMPSTNFSGYADSASEFFAAKIQAVRTNKPASATTTLSRTLRRINVVRNGEVEPSCNVRSTAEKTVKDLYNTALAIKSVWVDPHVTCQDEGDIVMEWWKGNRSLTIVASPEGAWYLETEEGSPHGVEGVPDNLDTQVQIWSRMGF